jgi:multidomain signaling protein FimX
VPGDKTLRLIMLNGSADEAELLANTCRNAGLATRYRHVLGAEEVQAVLLAEDQEWDMVLAQGAEDVLHALTALQRCGKDVPVIVVSGEVDDAKATEVLSHGARDIIAPQPRERLLHVLRRELGDLEQRRSVTRWERELRECEQRSEAVLESSRDAIAYIHQGMHLYANPVYLDLFGFASIEDIQGMPLLDMIAPKDKARFKEYFRSRAQGGPPQRPMEIRARRVDGGEFTTALELQPAGFAGEACIQITLRHPSADTKLQEELAKVSKQDPLTGLFNRQYFLQALENAVAKATTATGDSILLYLELDEFRIIQDNIGVAAADVALKNVAGLLREKLSPGELLARFGDDAFVALVDGDDLEHGRVLAENLRQTMEEHVLEVEGGTVIITCSVGVCLISARLHNVQEALRCVETACTHARKAGGNRIEVYQASLQEYAEEKQWPKRIIEALANDRFRLVFQPIVSLHGKPQAMYQVLARMVDEQGNIIPPRQFLSAAVKVDLMTAFDRWVIEHVITTAAAQPSETTSLRFFLNLSDQALQDKTLMPWIVEKLRGARLPANCLTFEVNEAAALLHLNAARAFANTLHELQCQLALAHFGAGTNPLGILKHLTVDYLLIDGSLIHSLAQDAHRQNTLKSIVDAANSLGKLAIAEDVEDATSLALVWQHGVHYAMGYYIQGPSATLDFDFSPSV